MTGPDGSSSQTSDERVTAEASGSGAAVNIVLGTEAIKPIMWFLAVILALVILLGLGTVYAIVKAEAYRDDAITKTQEERITQSKIESLRNEVAELKGQDRRHP